MAKEYRNIWYFSSFEVCSNDLQLIVNVLMTIFCLVSALLLNICICWKDFLYQNASPLLSHRFACRQCKGGIDPGKSFFPKRLPYRNINFSLFFSINLLGESTMIENGFELFHSIENGIVMWSHWIPTFFDETLRLRWW